MESDLDNEVISIDSNHPYIGLVTASSSVQVFLVVEREVLQSLHSDSTVFLEMISMYFTFNMVYPRPLYPVLIFVQHFVLVLKDKQPIPTSVMTLVSSLDKLKL